MRTFIFALAAIVLASCVIGQAGAADRLPAFDIARNCNEETSGYTGAASCTKDETDAKDELAQPPPLLLRERDKGPALLYSAVSSTSNPASRRARWHINLVKLRAQPMAWPQ